MENNNLENEIIENKIIKKKGRPQKIVGETKLERNRVTMKKLNESGYFKEYYRSKCQEILCDCCKTIIVTNNIINHQKTKKCSNKTLQINNDLLKDILTKYISTK